MSTCDVCDEKAAVVTCEECGMALCAEDDESVHKPAKLAGHKRVKVGGGAANGSTPQAAAAPAPAAVSASTPSPASSAKVCELCEEQPATIVCDDCGDGEGQVFCSQCNQSLHKPARMVAHKRRALVAKPEAAAPSPVASPAATPAKPAAAAAPSTPPKSTKPVEEEKEESASTPSAAAAAVTTPSSSNTTPVRPIRAMSASASTSSLGQSRGRPRSSSSVRSAMSATSVRKLEVPASLAGAPKALQQALSPARNVLSMSFGSRWEEPDLRPYKSDLPGTFGTTHRDGSPSKQKNLLYSKSASDLLGQRVGEGNPVWVRLAKPKVFVSSVISPLFDDIKNCSFKPSISQLSQTIAPGQFQERLAQSVKLYKDKRLAPEGTGWTDPELTLKPKLNTNKDGKRFEKVSSTSFVDRMFDDLKDRKLKLKAIEESQLHSFQPVISKSSQKRAAKIKTPFLERLKDDLDSREDGKLTRQAEAEKLPFPFHPNPDAKGKLSFNVFLGRMENDLDQRKEQYDARCAMFGVPTPDELAAAVRGTSAPAKRR